MCVCPLHHEGSVCLTITCPHLLVLIYMAQVVDFDSASWHIPESGVTHAHTRYILLGVVPRSAGGQGRDVGAHEPDSAVEQ